MTLTFVHHFVCPCGVTSEGVLVASTRINKSSFVTSNGLGVYPDKCKGCGSPLNGDHFTGTEIHEPDRERVNAHRAKKGWAPMESWRVQLKAVA